MHILLLPVGSHGDVHPAVGLGLRLQARGHRVTVITNGHFESLVRDAGLAFIATSTSEQYLQTISDPDIWHPKRAFFAVARSLMDLARPTYDILAELHAEQPGQLLAIGTSLALAGRLAQEKLGLPFVSMHLSPALFQSVYETPRLPGGPSINWAPRWLKRILFLVANGMIDRAICPGLNTFRAELSLPPIKGVLKHWWHSPTLVLAMFPDWYCAVQPDWPPHTHAVGFPMYDEKGVTPLPAALAAFLSAGPAPVAFTPGSAMFHADEFFATSAEACRLAGLRGVLLTRKREQVPKSLPPGVIHIDYAPFSELLPRCAALVHHGGIGTSAQALAAGVPQLVQPFAHDQPDNAERLEKIGVARTVNPRHYKPPYVACVLTELTTSRDIRESCRQAADRMRGADAIGTACSLIEGLL
ncbi:glycosyltransferase [Humisphaera borealis]|uniref:Glycosyltransferase family 1 protein n=1 Tax=Humisphaera borealis TaxID=2807512 RepID=A0A7M2X599_9BACT|nr:glycosyltransferase [Humisphaera borealis]QOV91970.1 glycosyltransferase family 1 protein [Humisphaera borealis]